MLGEGAGSLQNVADGVHQWVIGSKFVVDVGHRGRPRILLHQPGLVLLLFLVLFPRR